MNKENIILSVLHAKPDTDHNVYCPLASFYTVDP